MQPGSLCLVGLEDSTQEGGRGLLLGAQGLCPCGLGLPGPVWQMSEFLQALKQEESQGW